MPRVPRANFEIHFGGISLSELGAAIADVVDVARMWHCVIGIVRTGYIRGRVRTAVVANRTLSSDVKSGR